MRDATPPDLLTVGVEEEFLLIDPDTGHVMSAAPQVLRRIGRSAATQVVPELMRFQIETNSAAHVELHHLQRDLLHLRTLAAEAAESVGVRLIACGTALLGNDGVPPLLPSSRYLKMYRHYRALLHGQGVCGCHVHVGIADRQEAVQVSNHLRGWLPLLQALSANSPIADGADTGYASWRAMLWSRWPSAGPPPLFASAEHYDTLVDALIDSGALLDVGMVYWMIRPSHHLPTLEFRVADTCATVQETALLAGLVRALAATALAEVRQGRTAPPMDHTLLCAACWRAARDGLEGRVLDPALGHLVPTWHLIGRLLQRIRPALEEGGDWPMVTAGLHRLWRHGSAAARQRTAYQRRGHIPDVAELLIRQTRAIPAALQRHPGITAQACMAGARRRTQQGGMLPPAAPPGP